jgi:DNA sulfur modification protein DndC
VTSTELQRQDVLPVGIADGHRDLRQKIEATRQALGFLLEQGYDHWVVMFSGGKDSSTVAVLALEYAASARPGPKALHVVYVDTGLEIPTLHGQAMKFLLAARRRARQVLARARFHVTRPPVERSYWVYLLGQGYPPPHQKFRWCIQRLKTEPARNFLARYGAPERTVILTGVRFKESLDRDRRLAAACSRGGECSQGVLYQHAASTGSVYVAPIVDWRDCDVWDFLTLIAPLWGYPTCNLVDVYGTKDTRFGCWACTVVRQDRTMQRIVQTEAGARLAPLAVLRDRIWEATRGDRSRVKRPDGTPGRLRLTVRKELLREVLKAQRQTGLRLISAAEIRLIRHLWKAYPMWLQVQARVRSQVRGKDRRSGTPLRRGRNARSR